MLRFITAGESHGPSQHAILEGIPAGLPLDETDIQPDVNRRKKGPGRGGRGLIETDTVQILSGLKSGKTIGSPIALMIVNQDFKNWKDKNDNVYNPRPGHADLAGAQKYGFDNIRNVIERASARETVMRTAVGAICRKFLKEFNISIISKPIQIGKSLIDARPSINNCNCENIEFQENLQINNIIKRVLVNKDTLGGVIEVTACGIPPGLGSYIQWDKRLDGLIAQALMSIPSVKAVEIGEGIKSAGKTGSEVHDQINWLNGKFKRLTNRAGGIEAGVSNGENIICRVFLKPLPTLGKPLDTVDIKSKKQVKGHIERSDICVVPRAGVVCETMLAYVLTQVFLEKYGGDSMKETIRNFNGYINNINRF